jgi:hypothetical protein
MLIGSIASRRHRQTRLDILGTESHEITKTRDISQYNCCRMVEGMIWCNIVRCEMLVLCHKAHDELRSLAGSTTVKRSTRRGPMNCGSATKVLDYIYPTPNNARMEWLSQPWLFPTLGTIVYSECFQTSSEGINSYKDGK